MLDTISWPGSVCCIAFFTCRTFPLSLCLTLSLSSSLCLSLCLLAVKFELLIAVERGSFKFNFAFSCEFRKILRIRLRSTCSRSMQISQICWPFLAPKMKLKRKAEVAVLPQKATLQLANGDCDVDAMTLRWNSVSGLI